MSLRDEFRPRHVVAIAAILGTAYMMGPVAAQAVGSLTTIVDDNTSSAAQVDSGKLRVGDGSGALTVDGRVDAYALQRNRGNSFTAFKASTAYTTVGCLSPDSAIDFGITAITVRGRARIERRSYNGSVYSYKTLWDINGSIYDASQSDSVAESTSSVSFPTPIAVSRGTATKQCIYVTLIGESSVNVAYFKNT